MYERQASATSQTIDLNLVKLADGTPFTGLLFNTAGLVARYHAPGSASVSFALATQTVGGAWSSGGFVEVHATELPGLYRLDVPNAVLAVGTPEVYVMVSGAGVRPTPVAIQLRSFQPHTKGALNVDNLDLASSVIASYVDTEVAAIKAKTDNLPVDPADASDIAASFSAIAATLAALFTTAMAESYAADAATMTPAQALYEIRALLSEFAIVGTTLTTKKKDGVTTAATYTLDSATTPTAITRTT